MINCLKYIIIDLEWNGAFSGKLGHYFNEIIEIGAVALDDNFNVTGEFSEFVSPKFNKKLSGRVKRLTHISNNQVSGGVDFLAAYEQLGRWIGKEENCVMSFGTGDILVLMENLEVYRRHREIAFMHSYCDLQMLCQKNMDVENGLQLGLSAMAERLGIEVGSMDMHRALDDSKVSAECLKRAYSQKNYDSLVKKADSEFYEWLTFKTVIVCDLKNPIIKPAMFMVKCPECGVLLKRTSEVVNKGRCFTAQYMCGMCGKSFDAKHYIKIKYEGVVNRTTLAENSPAAKQEEA